MEISNKDKIQNIALKLFAQKGFDAIGVQEICNAAKITKPTLYYYFGNKDGLLSEILNSNYDKLNSLLQKNSQYEPNLEVYEKDVYPILIRVAKSYFDFQKQNKEFYKMVLLAQFAPPSAKFTEISKEKNRIQFEILEKMFKKMAESHGNMRKREVYLAASFIGLINTFIALDKDFDLEKIIHQFMHGIFN